MVKKTFIGVSASIIVDNSDIFPGYRRTYVNEDYISAVIKNNACPIILGITDNEDVIDSYIDSIDGLILSGGHDICPRYYGEEPLAKLGEILPERDEFDFKLIKKAMEKNIPILGICRGFQLINVYFGGSLYQDLSYSDYSFIKHFQGHSPNMTSHSVTIEKDSLLFDILKKEKTFVNSFHHQSVNKIGEGLKVLAKANDNIIEAIQKEDYKFLLGVQWHPEMLHSNNEEMNNIFKAFINEASNKSSGKKSSKK